jgi:hypothetical protein
MPDELSPYAYERKSKEQLVELLNQRDGEINGWRELWRAEQRQRIALEEQWKQMK